MKHGQLSAKVDVTFVVTTTFQRAGILNTNIIIYCLLPLPTFSVNTGYAKWSKKLLALQEMQAYVKVKVMSICIAPIHETSLRRSGIARIVKEYQFYLHTLHFILKQNEPYLPLPSQPKLVLIYWPKRDGRLSIP